MSDPRSDQALVNAVRRGDTSAFDALYERHRDFVWRAAIRATNGDEHAALDAAQETFAWLLTRCRSRLILSGKLSTYLYPAIRNIAITRIRRIRREVLGLVPERSEPTAPDSGDIEHIVAGLPDGQREVLLLRFVEDLSLLEIAAALDIPTGTVKSRLHHALAALRASDQSLFY